MDKLVKVLGFELVVSEVRGTQLEDLECCKTGGLYYKRFQVSSLKSQIGLT